MRSFWLFEPWPRIALVLTSAHCTTASSLLKIWMNMNGEYENATSWPNWIQFKQDLRLDDKNFRESWKNRRKISGKCFFSKKWTSLEFGCWHGRSLTQHKICKENSNKVVAEGKEGGVWFSIICYAARLQFSRIFPQILGSPFYLFDLFLLLLWIFLLWQFSFDVRFS